MGDEERRRRILAELDLTRWEAPGIAHKHFRYCARSNKDGYGDLFERVVYNI
jgi:hypothetical protein